MSSPTQARPPMSDDRPIPPLENGEHLDQPTFHERYEAMPPDTRAELVGGVVYMPSPVSTVNHGEPHFELITWLGIYRLQTPGVLGADNATNRLDNDNEPQPDAHLRIEAAHGGQSHVGADRYVEGAPELVAEVAVSSIPIDLNVKLPLYQRNGVREYILWRVPDDAMDWFVLRGERYERLPLEAGGVYKSEVFPGLWLAPLALVRGEGTILMQVAQQGLASPEHAAFVRRLREHADAHNP